MIIAFVVQRYGEDIIGGAEYLTRLIAEHMIKYHEIEVLSTCAKDYHTWKNEYKKGTETINGVLVRRFANSKKRDLTTHIKIQEKAFFACKCNFQYRNSVILQIFRILHTDAEQYAGYQFHGA